MARRRPTAQTEYKVQVPALRQARVIPGRLWVELVQKRYIVPTSKRSAALREGVVALLVDGNLQLIDTQSGAGIWIKTSWYGVLRAALYDQRGPNLTPEEHQREVQKGYCDRY